MEHYKKFPVSSTGGLILSKDLARYQEVISAWNSNDLNNRFEILKEVGNLFIVKPENLKVVINEGYYLL